METTVPVKYKKDEMLDAVSRKIKYTFKNVHRAKSTHTHVCFIYTRCSVIWCQIDCSLHHHGISLGLSDPDICSRQRIIKGLIRAWWMVKSNNSICRTRNRSWNGTCSLSLSHTHTHIHTHTLYFIFATIIDSWKFNCYRITTRPLPRKKIHKKICSCSSPCIDPSEFLMSFKWVGFVPQCHLHMWCIWLNGVMAGEVQCGRTWGGLVFCTASLTTS